MLSNLVASGPQKSKHSPIIGHVISTDIIKLRSRAKFLMPVADELSGAWIGKRNECFPCFCMVVPGLLRSICVFLLEQLDYKVIS